MPIRRTLKDYLVGFFFGVPVGVLAGGMALELGCGDWLSMCVVAISALLSQDILLALINHRAYLGKLFQRASENIVDKVTK